MVKRAFAALLCLVNGLLIAVYAHGESVPNGVHHGVILQYHHISTRTPSSTSLAPEVFRQHLDILKTEGYQVIPLPRLVQALQQGVALPDRAVVITFDDAYDDIARTAAPMLAEYGFPFTLFVSTDFVDRRQSGYMSWDQIRELKAQGATIANHSRSHLHLLRPPAELTNQQWQAQLRDELDGAEQRIKEETGAELRYFAYPYGEADEVTVALIKSWGYLGFGQQSGAVDQRLLRSGMAPRYPFNQMYQDLADFRVKASSLPLPLRQEVAPGTVFEHATIPELRLQLEPHSGRLNCFASGQGPIRVEEEAGQVYRIRANQPIGVGRSRYNCTLAVEGQKGRYHWYSRMWIRKQDDGGWYPEP